MEKIDLYPWLVKYHCNINLKKCIPHIINGVICDEKGNPLTEGKDKNMPYQGFLIVANGNTLVDRLKKEKVVHDEKLGTFVNIDKESSFRNYLLSQEEEDGSYMFDSVNNRIIHVAEINNNHELPNGKSMYDMVPKDFFSYNSQIEGMFGTKTGLAIRLPHAYDNTETYQIKRSAYGPLRMGKVTHFNKQGLVEELFLMYDPSSKGHLVRPDLKIIGVHRKYARKNDELVKIMEKLY